MSYWTPGEHARAALLQQSRPTRSGDSADRAAANPTQAEPLFIITALGHEVGMRNPRAASIVLADIAHHLAQINRFSGGARRPYSVAEHSLLVCEIAEREFCLPLAGRLAALMHDAHEAYVGDLHTPGKAEVGPAWGAFEARFEHLVQRCFHISAAALEFKAQIKAADLIALATERMQLLPAGTPWRVLAGVTPVTWVDLMERGRCSFDWSDWRRVFSDKVDELDFARQLPTGPGAQS